MVNSPVHDQSFSRLSRILGGIGVVLIVVGIAWIIAINWHWMNAGVKIGILAVCVAVSFFLGMYVREKNHLAIGGSLLCLGSLLYTLSVFLIAQIYGTSTSLQGTAWLLLISLVGVFIAAYSMKSGGSLVVGLVEFTIWIALQYFAFSEYAYSQTSSVLLCVLALALAGIAYVSAVLHREQKHAFVKIWQWWTGLYVLLFAYVLSFQYVIENLFYGSFNAESIVFVSVVAGIAIVGLLGVVLARAVTRKEAGLVALVLLVYGGLLLLGQFGVTQVNDARYGYSYGYELTLLGRIVWLLSNTVFIGVIVLASWIGISRKVPVLVNVALGFFVIDILTRYIGFWSDLGYYEHLSLLFISGGVMLLGGGILIERLRRKLVNLAQISR